MKLSTSLIIDSLIYGYNVNTNQLNYVNDKSNDTTAHLGDFTEINNNTTQDYWYDGNGSMTKDNNKNIANIHYNELNLPDSITVTGKGYIKYVYTASGVKLQKITIDNVINKKTVINYSGPFVYQYTSTLAGTGLDTLQFIIMEEGRIRSKSINKCDTVFYDFFKKTIWEIQWLCLQMKKDRMYIRRQHLKIMPMLMQSKKHFIISVMPILSAPQEFLHGTLLPVKGMRIIMATHPIIIILMPIPLR